MKRALLVALMGLALWPAALSANPQQTTPNPASNPPDPESNGSILLTIFLKHDQSKPLAEINAELERQGFYRAFPPPGVEVVSWYVMMGIGQVVTLRVPADRLREVNRAIEETAWGAFRTEFYPTYDLRTYAEGLHAKATRREDPASAVSK